MPIISVQQAWFVSLVRPLDEEFSVLIALVAYLISIPILPYPSLRDTLPKSDIESLNIHKAPLCRIWGGKGGALHHSPLNTLSKMDGINSDWAPSPK